MEIKWKWFPRRYIKLRIAYRDKEIRLWRGIFKMRKFSDNPFKGKGLSVELWILEASLYIGQSRNGRYSYQFRFEFDI